MLLDVVGREFDGLANRLLGLARASGPGVRETERVPDAAVARKARPQRLELPDRLGVLARPRQRDAQLASRIEMIGMTLDLGGEALHRFGPLGLGVEQQADAIVGVPQSGIETERLP